MYKSQLIIESRFVDYDDDTSFVIRANNDKCSASLEFYGTTEEFADFGEELIDFPKNINQQVHYPPRGSYDPNVAYAYFLTIKAFCYDPSGHAALEVVIDTNGSRVYDYQARFCIEADVATLNKFGQRLKNWNVREVSKIALYNEE
jgi:hypothetical protein